MAVVRVGCSGFNYPHWRGPFYPGDLPQNKWLAFYCSQFNTVELNVTFYRLPPTLTFERWHDETPDDFVFAIKGSRFISHVKRLREPEESLDLFFDHALCLGEKLEVVLWQLPPSFGIDLDRLERFVSLLSLFPVRSALEFRHGSWITREVFDMCNTHGICLCMADWPEFIADLPATSDFAYIRRHGAGGYDQLYSAQFLRRDAQTIKECLKSGRDAYVYFNNDAFGYAPRNARQLVRML
ncbi:MAG: DUF72 domain-containing protein [Thermodesulfovibrionales bacterium]